MQITAEQLEKLGEAQIYTDQDVMYVTNGHWLIALVNYEAKLPHEVVSVIQSVDQPIDSRILDAECFVLDQGLFVPRNGHRPLPIASQMSLRNLSTEQMRNLINEYSTSIWGDVISLDEMYQQGKVRTEYEISDEEDLDDKRRFTHGRSGLNYVFDLDSRLYVMSVPLFSTFIDLGFSITVPATIDNPRTISGLYRDQECFGFLAPMLKSGATRDQQGRPLQRTEAELSWYSVEAGVGYLTAASNYNPTNVSENVFDAARNRLAYSELTLGIDILRYRGLSDEEIEGVYEENRRAGYETQLEEKFARLAGIIEQVGNEERLWSLNTIEADVRRTHGELRNLSEILGVDVDYTIVNDALYFINQRRGDLEVAV